MDNASKALIMAGSVLIAVLLVSLGVLLLRSMDPMISGQRQNVEIEKVESYNSQFYYYEGADKAASHVRRLIDLVESNKHNSNVTDVYGEITLTRPDNISNTKKYTITITSYDSNGVISGIEIKEQ